MNDPKPRGLNNKPSPAQMCGLHQVLAGQLLDGSFCLVMGAGSPVSASLSSRALPSVCVSALRGHQSLD